MKWAVGKIRVSRLIASLRPTEELQLQEDGHWGQSLDLPAPSAVRGGGLVNLRQGGDRRERKGERMLVFPC